MRTSLLAATSAAALGLMAFTPAMAAPAAGGYIQGGYADSSCSGCGGNINDWNISGAAETPLGGSNVTLQGDLSYHQFTISHAPQFHSENEALSLIYNAQMGRAGVTVGHQGFDAGGSGLSGTTWGGFGVLYPTSQITLGLKGSEWNVAHDFRIDSWGGEIKGYVKPNISLGLTYDNQQLHSCCGTGTFTTWGGAGEWQPTAQPWSVKLGYQNTRISGTNLNTWMINFRYNFGGGSTLVDHDRNGAETWGTTQTGFNFLEF